MLQSNKKMLNMETDSSSTVSNPVKKNQRRGTRQERSLSDVMDNYGFSSRIRDKSPSAQTKLSKMRAALKTQRYMALPSTS